MTDYYVDLDIPGRPELGPATSPADLAHVLAHALRASERQGSPRPTHNVRAHEAGNARDLTADEQKMFDTALEQALREV